jgi:hypothetical protein
MGFDFFIHVAIKGQADIQKNGGVIVRYFNAAPADFMSTPMNDHLHNLSTPPDPVDG